MAEHSQRLNVIALQQLTPFEEFENGYWLPFGGALSYLDTPQAALEDARDAAPEGRRRSIPLYNVFLHSKSSYNDHYDRIAQSYARTGDENPFEMVRRPSFEKPCLILRETEVEDFSRRAGSGITAITAEVCLPQAYREPIRQKLLNDPNRDWIVVLGFPVPDFKIPASRQIVPDAPFERHVWVFDVDDITVDMA